MEVHIDDCDSGDGDGLLSPMNPHSTTQALKVSLKCDFGGVCVVWSENIVINGDHTGFLYQFLRIPPFFRGLAL